MKDIIFGLTREVAWTPVLALVFSALAIVMAFVGATDLLLAFGATAITFAVLSGRE